jgi:transcriptional regulator with XRE-family HTH domain
VATFAELLAGLRVRAGLSQYALARRSGLSREALSRLEAGQRTPTWDTVQRLALALGVDCRSFVDEALTLPEVTPGRVGRPPKGAPPAGGARQPRPDAGRADAPPAGGKPRGKPRRGKGAERGG